MVRASIRLDYDDDVLTLVEKIDKALNNQYGLRLLDDKQEHDGFNIIELVEPGGE